MPEILQQQRILLIEDDAWIRTFLRDAVSDEGYAVIEAADGLTGLRLAAEQCPDVLLLDLAMPGFSGVDVLRELRRAPATRNVPVLILSAFKGVLPLLEATTVCGVLPKPIDVPLLLAAIEKALGTRGTNQVQTPQPSVGSASGSLQT
jgi:two-component system phosphate regulon response regulator PhoB